MAARSELLIGAASVFLLAGCQSTVVHVRTDLVPDKQSCHIETESPDELAKSQRGCHVGVPGDGVQILVSGSTRQVSVYSDATKRELLSIYVRPASAVRVPGPVSVDAFYSTGLADLTGKTGCVGVDEKSKARVEQRKGQMFLTYDLWFRLKSPLGWKTECDRSHHVTGMVKLPK